MLLTATAAMAQGNFSMKGTIKNAEGQTINLMYDFGPNPTTVSTTVKNGKFQFNGTLDKPYQKAVIYIGSLQDRNNKYVRFALEPGNLTTDIDGNNFKTATVHGGKTQEESNAFEASLSEINKQSEELEDAYYKANTEEERNAIKEKMEPLSTQLREARLHFIKTHPDSYLSPEFLRFFMSRMSFEELKSVYDNFTDIFPADMTVDRFCSLLAEYWGFSGYRLADTVDTQYYDAHWTPPAPESLLKDLRSDNTDNYYLTVFFEGDQEGVPRYIQMTKFPGYVQLSFGTGHSVG